MKIKNVSENEAVIEIQKGHTHYLFFSDTEETNTPFKKVRITRSDFPEGHQAIHVDTFNDGSIYIGIPGDTDLELDLKA